MFVCHEEQFLKKVKIKKLRGFKNIKVNDIVDDAIVKLQQIGEYF